MRPAPGSVPPSLAPKIEAAFTEALGKEKNVPAERRKPVGALRSRLNKEYASPNWAGFVSALLALNLPKYLTIFWSLLVAVAVGFAVYRLIGVFRRRRILNAKFSPELLSLAADAAELNEAETTAMGLWNAPRADADVRAEIERLLAEDARLVAAEGAIGAVDGEAIRADRLKIKLALAKAAEEGSDEREALAASLALCERRLEAAGEADALRRRIAAYRGLVLQSLRAAGEGLGRAGAGETPELARIQAASSALMSEAGAIEAAVQEARG